MTEYKADAYVRVPFSIYIEAASSLEAMEIADEKAKFLRFLVNTFLSKNCMNIRFRRMGMTVDLLGKVDSHPRTVGRPFIPDFDD